MDPTPPTEPAQTPTPPLVVADGEVFMRRMKMATYCIVLFVLSIHLLEKLRDILQPLFIALFLGFLTNPIHRWLVQRGFPSVAAYVVIGVLVMLSLFAFAS